MKWKYGDIKEDISRDLYWIKIIFLSDDEKKYSSVFACASHEYLHDYYKVPWDEKIKQEYLEDWQDNVIKKWSSFGEDILKENIHYVVYATEPDGEANGLDFLMSVE